MAAATQSSATDSVAKKTEHLEEYLVKETFVPTHHAAQPRKVIVRRRKQKKEESSLLTIFCEWIVEHQLGILN